MSLLQLNLSLILALVLVVCVYWYGSIRHRLWQAARRWIASSVEKHRRRQLRIHAPDARAACMAERQSNGVKVVEPAVPVVWSSGKSRRRRRKEVTSAGYSCPNAQCAYYQVTDGARHALVSHGWRGQRERIRQWCCQACGTRFTSRRNTALYWLKTPSAEVGLVMTALGEGMDLAAGSRTFGYAVTTIARWQRRAAQHMQRLHERWLMRLKMGISNWMS